MRCLCIVLLAGTLLLPTDTWACDVCGVFLGIRPHDQNNTLSLLYLNRVLQGDVMTNSTFTGGPKHATEHESVGNYREIYQTVELRTTQFVAERWYLTLGVPFVNRYRSIDQRGQADLYGLGDILLLGNHLVVRPTKATKIRHRLSVGAGTRIPTGSTKRELPDGHRADLDLQPGTGSWSVLLNLDNTLLKGTWGSNISLVGMLNRNNADDHRYGHAMNAMAAFFRQWSKGEFTAAPTLGAYWELNGNEFEGGEKMEDTAGQILFAQLGARLWYGKWALRLFWQHALAEQHSELVPPNRSRCMAGVTYAWNKN